MKSIKKYAHNRFRNLCKQLQRYEQRTNPDTLHRIRVELKKIKALFHLVGFCTDDFNARKKYKPLKKIFKMAGCIREFDVVVQMLHKYKIDSIRYDSHSVAERKKESIACFRKNIFSYRHKVSRCYKKMSTYFNEVNLKCSKKYILCVDKDLKQRLFPRIRAGRLHESRKLLKEIIYLSPLYTYNAVGAKYYHELQDVIGDWHDKQMLINVLENDRSCPNPKVIKKLKMDSFNDLRRIKSGLRCFSRFTGILL